MTLTGGPHLSVRLRDGRWDVPVGKELGRAEFGPGQEREKEKDMVG